MRPIRTLTLWLLAVLVVVAGACSPSGKADDPNKPALVKGPPVVLPSDTLKPDTVGAARANLDAARIELTQNYAVLSAAAIFGDQRMLNSMYAPNAVLLMSDSTFNGAAAAAAEMAALARRISMTEMQRAPLATTLLPDSVVSDSGSYVITSKRGAQNAVVQRGVYSARWRMHAPGTPWTLMADRLIPLTSVPGKAPARAKKDAKR